MRPAEDAVDESDCLAGTIVAAYHVEILREEHSLSEGTPVISWLVRIESTIAAGLGVYFAGEEEIHALGANVGRWRV